MNCLSPCLAGIAKSITAHFLAKHPCRGMQMSDSPAAARQVSAVAASLATRTAAFSASLWIARMFLSLSPRPRLMAATSRSAWIFV